MTIYIVIIVSVPIIIFVSTFLLFFHQKSDSKHTTPSVNVRPPQARGTNISTFGMHPRRRSAIHDQHAPDAHGVDEHERVHQATIKARETVRRYTTMGAWDRRLYFLNLGEPQIRCLTGALLLVASASVSLLILFLFITGFTDLEFLAIFMLLWLFVWGMSLDLLWRVAQLGIDLVEDTLPFSFLFIWAAVRAGGDVSLGVLAAAEVVGEDSRSLPLVSLFGELIEATRRGNTIEELFDERLELKVFPNVYHFFSSLNSYSKGVSASGRIEDLYQFYRSRRKTRGTSNKVRSYIQVWTVSTMLYDVISYVQYKGIDWKIPVISAYVFPMVLLLVGASSSFPLPWIFTALSFMVGVLFLRRQVRETLDHSERELAIALRPFLARLRQGVHPTAALADVYGFLRRGSPLEQQFEAIISFKGDRRELASLVSKVARSSASPVIERFWLTCALAMMTNAEIAPLIEELLQEVYK